MEEINYKFIPTSLFRGRPFIRGFNENKLYHRLYTIYRAPVAQLVEHRAVTREVVSSTPAGPTLRVFKYLRRKCCLCNYICKWLDSLVFSDKDDKPEVPSHNPSMFTILWDVKEPAHLSQSVGHVVPGVVVCLLWYYYRGPCVRKLFTGLIMYYPLKIKNIVLYCIVYSLSNLCSAKLTV